jgi:hypothetical protein
VKKDVQQQRSYKLAASDPASILSAELAALNLPTSVTYALETMGASMAAAVEDGPLPIGDILFAAATVTAVVVIAVNWNEVAPKWNKIVKAFKKAFSKSSSNVTSAFEKIYKDVQAKIKEKPSLTINGKKVIINTVEYNCTTKAEALTKKQKNAAKYYPAVLYKGAVYVDTAHPLDTSKAKLFIYANNKTVGVFATSKSYAQGICGGFKMYMLQVSDIERMKNINIENMIDISESIDDYSYDSFMSACFQSSNMFSLSRARWTTSTCDELECDLKKWLITTIKTSKWFGYDYTIFSDDDANTEIEINIYEANNKTKEIILKYTNNIYLEKLINGEFDECHQTLEDICFFRDTKLIVGTVSHEGMVCMLPINDALKEFI